MSGLVRPQLAGNNRKLERDAEASRQRRSTRAEEAASRASVKMLAPMLLIFASILLLIVAPMFFQIQTSFETD